MNNTELKKPKHGSEGNVISHFERVRRYGAGALCTMLLAGAVAACDSDTAPQFALENTGSLQGLLFFDADNNGLFDPSAGDTVLKNVHVSVQERGTTSTIAGATATTDANGRFSLASVPIGSHSLAIDTAGVGTTVNFCQNPVPIDVFIAETQFIAVNGKAGCLVTIFVAESKPLKSPVTVAGTVTSSTGQISTNGPTAFIEDATGGIQIFGNVGTTLQIGDVVEIQGVLDIFSNSEYEITAPKLNSKTTGTPIVPAAVTTKQIQDAGLSKQDNLQGRLVKVSAAKIKDAFLTGGGRNVVIDDGSGVTTARLESAPFPQTTATLPTSFPVGKCYDITGIVRGFSSPAVELVPRSASDIVEVTCKS
jgi:DNA/RNA endonuclease YhcR with UshA esterase domain